MTQVKVRLDRAMETSLVTLYGKALDARMTPSILNDHMAVEALSKIDYDFSRMKAVNEKVAPNAASRSKHFDDWTREFLAANPTATVVHLACGLDTRVWRIDPGPSVAWFDVDFPDVIDVRRKLFPARPGYQMIASSVTSEAWLSAIPTDRPVFLLAEGLTMYLSPADGHLLFRRVVDHFGHGTFAFDGHNRYGIWLVNLMLKRAFGNPMLEWAINSRADIDAIDSRLHCVNADSALLAPASRALPPSTRLLTRLVKHFPPLRDLGLYLRYTF
ncbi:class I SAM-dependent methyltransferase [Kutzneria kofuensis]|uniref:O-methyltransferase involved in polyketide biosynthesis n=1 Tax=Kutzneria kofuensis TaxID=103725 RepID=A0A7W9NKE1_9PSEU|nr:class I SAM-dependent methyltransferase [Kutzneria kofuensis]MBB5895163.1 O-methyltransferase involved in polyketide biosynthesis [Kutzneria kofuensis]